MQYILTEEEYKNLVPKSRVIELEDKIEKLNTLVLEKAGRKCWKDVCSDGYCDFCPITFSCNKTKYFSK